MAASSEHVAASATARAAAAGTASQPLLSLVIPAYNEERRLGPTLHAILEYLAGRPYTSEVIVVSDGSTDGTELVARREFERVRDSARVSGQFLGYMPNAGKGVAVRTGVAGTRGRYVAFADADLSTPIEEVDRALPYLRGAAQAASLPPNETGPDGAYQVVIGSRAAQGADVRRKQPLYRRMSAKFFNFVRDTILGIHDLRDTQCGLKVFDGDVARAVFARQRIPGFMFDPETVLICQRLGLPIYEMGVRWTDSPDSRVRLSSGLRMIPDLLRIRLMHGRLSPADLSPMLEAQRRRQARAA